MNNDYGYWETVPTRWKDNDVYGHVNNIVHYSVMDTIINNWLIREAGLDIHEGDQIGVCVHSQCTYKGSISYPEPFRVGLRIAHIGRSSVHYDVGLFHGGERTLIAEGRFVHVFVDRATRRAAEIAEPMREAMRKLLHR